MTTLVRTRQTSLALPGWLIVGGLAAFLAGAVIEHVGGEHPTPSHIGMDEIVPDYERLYAGEVVSGRILCLELPTCQVYLGDTPLVLQLMDISSLPPSRQMRIFCRCLTTHHWGCPARFAAYPGRGYVLYLKSVQFDDISL